MNTPLAESVTAEDIDGILKRYKKAHKMGSRVDDAGSLLALAGGVVGVIVFFTWQNLLAGQGALLAAPVGVRIFISFLMAAPFVILGTVLMGMAKIIQSAAETAINTSSVLPEADKLRAIRSTLLKPVQ